MKPHNPIPCAPCDSHDLQLSCIHHWMVDTPRGEFSGSTCKLCNRRRTFRNYQSDDFSPDRIPYGHYK